MHILLRQPVWLEDVSMLDNNVPLLGMKRKLSMLDADEPICCSLLDDMRESNSGDNYEFLASNDDNNLSEVSVSELDGSVVSYSTDPNIHQGSEVALCANFTCSTANGCVSGAPAFDVTLANWLMITTRKAVKKS